MQTYLQHLESLPIIQGTRPDGTPIEAAGGGAISERGHFFTLKTAAEEAEKLADMLPSPADISDPTPNPDNGGYTTTGDSAKLKRYDVSIFGRKYDLGSVVGFVSIFPGLSWGYYGMKGKLEPTDEINSSGLYLKFTPDSSVPAPQPPPADAPPFPAPAGQEWVKGMMGWALVSKNQSGYTEAQISDILNRVGKALRGQ